MARTLFVAANGQHVGKTTVTLGLAANLQALGHRVGYCKPVGHQYVTVDGVRADKDAVLFGGVLGFELNPQLHSPVILGDGLTADFIHDPSSFHFQEDILRAHQQLAVQYDVVIHEGTGHPGVGSVVDISNARVARMLNADVLLVSEGGIGSTVDRLSLSAALFRQENARLVGVIINKVRADKMDKVRELLDKRLGELGLPVVGYIPFDKTLSYPILDTIKNVLKGRVIFNEDRLINRVENIMSGSLIDTDGLPVDQNNLLVVSYKRFDEAMTKVQRLSAQAGLDRSPLCGVLVTGDGRQENFFNPNDFSDEYFRVHRIPLITTTLDTLGSVIQINRLEVKINPKTPWKVHRAIEMVRDHLPVASILS